MSQYHKHTGPFIATHRYFSRILSVIAVSFVARGLSTIRSQIFCYAAISSAGVVTVLPGYLICKQSFSGMITMTDNASIK